MKYDLPKNWRCFLIAVLVVWSGLSFAANNTIITTTGFFIAAECHDFSASDLSSTDANHCSPSVSAILTPHNLTYEYNAVSPNNDIDDLYQFHLYLREKKPPRYPILAIRSIHPE
jgi:hypothetical protein